MRIENMYLDEVSNKGAPGHLQIAIDEINYGLNSLFLAARSIAESFYEDIDALRLELSERNHRYSRITVLVQIKGNSSLEISWRLDRTRRSLLGAEASMRSNYIPKGRGATYSKVQLRHACAPEEFELVWAYEQEFAQIRTLANQILQARLKLHRIIQQVPVTTNTSSRNAGSDTHLISEELYE